MMARQWTKEETARGWLVAAQGETVAPPSLHPEADARLAEATGRTAVSVGSAAIDRVLNSAPWQAMLATPPTTYSAPSTPGNASGHAFASGHDLAGGPPAPAKPSALAAGQVWQMPDGDPILLRYLSDDPEKWEIAWGSGFLEHYGQILAYKLCDAFGARYLGTREEVAAAAHHAAGERMVAKARERADNEVREEAARLGVGIDFTGAAPTLTDRGESIRAIHDGIITRLREGAPSPSEIDADLRKRLAERAAAIAHHAHVGTRSWFASTFARALSVPLEDITISSPRVGAVGIEARGRTEDEVRLAILSLCGWLPTGVKVCAARPGAAALATLRAEIDRLIAADHGPFAAARAAALRCYSEPHPGPRDHNPDRLQKARAESAWMKPAPGPRDAGRLFAALLRYETARGGARLPAPAAQREADLIEPHVLAIYERERSRSDVYARPRRR